MDPIQLLDQYGLPIAILIPVGYFLWKQQHWIQNELIEDLEERFKRLEGIIITLINQQKKMQIELRGIMKKYEALVEIINKLILRSEKDKK
jgi:chaperonin cofactor prefoldin